MKTLLLVLMTVPLAAQQPAAPPKPEEQKPAESKPEQPAPAPTPETEPWLTGTVDFGYRFMSDVRGDFNTYRSVVDLGEGPRLFGVDATITGVPRLFDRIDVHANSWGGDPYNTARINARREGAYELRFDYRNIIYFNFLPSFANPQLERGLFLSQRTYDTYRRNSEFELTLLPGRRIVPFIAYGRNASRGSGALNFVLSSNEYTVPNRFRDHSDDFRGGVRFEFNRFHFTVEQGRLTYHIDQQSFNTEPRNLGNLLTPILGQQLFLASGNQSLDVRGEGNYTRGLLTANPLPWLDVTGQFLFSQPENHTVFSQNNQGNFLDAVTRQFYNAQLAGVTSQAVQPHTSGNLTLELRPLRRVRVFESWLTDRLHDASSAVLLDRLLTGGNPFDTRTVNSAERTELTYNQQQLDLIVDVTPQVSLRGGHRYVWGDARLPAAFVLEGRQSEETGQLRRHVLLAGGNARFSQRYSVNADFEASSGDRSYLRTSLHEYQRAKIRARAQVLPSLLFSANFSVLNNENPQPGVNFDFLSRQNTLAANWTPAGGKWVGLLAEYTRFTLHSNLTYLVPNTLDREASFYRDSGHSGTALLDINLIPAPAGYQPKISVGGALFLSNGSRPTRYYQPMWRITQPFGNRAAYYAEWRWYGLSQPFYLFEGFRSHQFVTGLRLTM